MNILIFPFFLPLATAIMLLFWRTPSPVRRWVTGISSAIQIWVAFSILFLTFKRLVLVLPLGGWIAPIGITLAVDVLGAVMLILTTLVSFFCILYSFAQASPKNEPSLRLPLIQLLIAGVCLAFSTGDFFNLFVSFEILLIASYALISLEARDSQLKHVFSYLSINVVGGILFLCTTGFIYVVFGNLNFAVISEQAGLMAGDPRLLIIAVLLVFVFGIKSGLFPLYFWLPNSYPILSAPLLALFGALLTKVGIYSFLRIFGTVFPHYMTFVYLFLVCLSVPTMVFAALFALNRKSMRGILILNLVSHIGVLVLGIGVFTMASVSGVFYYMIHHVLVMASLFLIAGIVTDLCGSDELDKMGGLWQKVPILSFLFLIQALSLAGIPPFSGFWGKLMILTEGIRTQSYFLVGFLVFASVLTLLSMLYIILDGFWRDRRSDIPLQITPRTRAMTVLTGVLVVISVGIGVRASDVIVVSQVASKLLFSPVLYSKLVVLESENSRIK